jgi:DNA-binding HxlR family transcriptional regulator
MVYASQVYDEGVTEIEPGTVRLEGVLADRDGWTASRCSIDRAFSAIGSRSALLMLREALYGTRRFDEFARRVGVTEAVAAARLRELVELGIFEKRPYREEGQRTRHEYVLTQMGEDMLPIALALLQWGDAYLAGPAGPPLRVTHIDCGEPISVHVQCAAGHELSAEDISVSVAPRLSRH